MMSGQGFLTPAIMQGQDWKGLELAIARIISHCGWRDIQYVGGSGDKGADVLAVKTNPTTGRSESYLFQSKSVQSSGYVGVPAITQALQGQAIYHTNIVVVVTNGDFTKSAIQKKDELQKEGYNVRLWNGVFLNKLWECCGEYSVAQKELRGYQTRIIETVISAYKNKKRKPFLSSPRDWGKLLLQQQLPISFFSLA